MGNDLFHVSKTFLAVNPNSFLNLSEISSSEHKASP